MGYSRRYRGSKGKGARQALDNRLLELLTEHNIDEYGTMLPFTHKIKPEKVRNGNVLTVLVPWKSHRSPTYPGKKTAIWLPLAKPLRSPRRRSPRR